MPPAPVPVAPVVAAAPAPAVPPPGAPAVIPKEGAPPAAPKPAPEAKPAAPTEPAAPPEQKFKVKVDGEVKEFTLAEMERYASKGKFADKATQQAKEAIKRAQKAQQEFEAREKARLETAKKDIDAFLKEHGIDPDEYAKTKLERKVEEGKMTPEQRRAAELERENKRLIAEQEKAAAQRKEEQRQQLTEHLQRRIETELSAAAKRAGMQMGDETFFAIYESFREAYDLGLLPLDGGGLQPHHADRIVEEAQSRLDSAQSRIRENALKLRGQALLDFVGQEAADAILAARLEQHRQRRGLGAAPAAAPPAAQPAAQPRKYLSPSEADAELKRLTGGVVR